MVFLGILALLTVLLGGVALCHRFFAERDGLLLLAAGVPTGCVLLMVWCALTLPWMPMNASLGVAWILTLGPVGLWLKQKPDVTFVYRGLEGVFLALGSATVAFYSLHLLSMRLVVEDSFFVHTSNTGLMLNGFFPPVNFLGLPLHGHYGRDLVIAVLSRLSSLHFLDVEWMMITACQVLAFLLLYGWIRKDTGSAAQAAFGTGLVFFAANFCAFVGLLDFLTNNQAVASLAWILAGYAFFRCFEGPGWWLFGLILGADALLYEVHFVLLGGASCLLLILMGVLKWAPRETLVRLLGGLVVAAVVASVEGGAITNLVQTKLGLRKVEMTTHAQMESQHVAVSFPKEKLFQVRLDNLRPSRPFETKFRPWGGDFEPSDRYAPVFSQTVFSLFWYPVWLMPLSFLWLVRMGRKTLLGWWFFLFAGLGLLVPSLVGFGYFEQESGRWLSIVSSGWSLIFGLMLGWLWTAPKGPALVAGRVFAAVALWFSTAGLAPEFADVRYAYQHRGQPAQDGSPGLLPDAPLWPDPAQALAYHYKLEEADWEAAAWLRRHATPDQRFLMNYQDEAPSAGFRPRILSGGQLNRRGCMVGLSGILPVGITGGPENELAAPNFSPALQTWIFWATGDSRLLEPLQPDWVVANETTLSPAVVERLPGEPGLERRFQQGGRSIYRFNGSAFAGREAPGDARLIAERPRTEPGVRQFFEVEVKGEGLPPEGTWVQIRYRFREDVANARDLLTVPVDPETTSLPLAAPHVAGEYQIEYRLQGHQEWLPLTPVTVLPDRRSS